MIKIFVQANDNKGKPLVADLFEFEAVPRIGEEVVVNQGDEQFLLLVKGVTNFAFAKGQMPTAINLSCNLVDTIKLGQ